MSNESTEMNFIEVCVRYQDAKDTYKYFCHLAKKASSIGAMYLGAPKVSEYIEVYKSSWKLLSEDFGVYDSQQALYDEIKKLQRYGTTLDSFEEFMEPYCRKLDEKKRELRAELSKWETEMVKMYDEMVRRSNFDDASLLGYHVVKEFVLRDLCGLEKFKSTEV